ncbi:MAG: hypothetical protein ISS26_06225 [Candidatus Omnitrophica bacterium]|nr:hypothetical protein [Candidatus Omnitrophota bacterium]
MMKKIIILLIILMCWASGAYAKCSIDHSNGGEDKTTLDEERGLFEDKLLRSRDLKLKDGYEAGETAPQQPTTPKRKPTYGIDPGGFKLRDETDEPPNVTIPKDKQRTIVVLCCDNAGCECPQDGPNCEGKTRTCADVYCGREEGSYGCQCSEEFCVIGTLTPPCEGVKSCECLSGIPKPFPCPWDMCLPICKDRQIDISECMGAPSCMCIDKGKRCNQCDEDTTCPNISKLFSEDDYDIKKPCFLESPRRKCNCGCGHLGCQCIEENECHGRKVLRSCHCANEVNRFLGVGGGKAPAIGCPCGENYYCINSTSITGYALPCGGADSCYEKGCGADHCAGQALWNPWAKNACRKICASAEIELEDLTCGGSKTECSCAAVKDPDPEGLGCNCGTYCNTTPGSKGCDSKNKVICQ